MKPAELVHVARSHGVFLRVDGNRLIASPASELPAETRAALTAHRAEIIAYLVTEPPDGGHILDGGRQWIPAQARPGWCPCDEQRAWNPETGLCRGCFGAVYGARIPSSLMRGDS